MDLDHKRIQELVERLAESLNVEVKRWLGTDEPNEIAKIVRAVLALRNRNGGYLVIGFDDKTLQPDINNRPSDVKGPFHVDKVQGLISRYASELFEIGVAFPQLDGREYPVIVVPEGVQAPVAAKSDLFDAVGKSLVRSGEVYFRTLAANGTPSTAPARPQDWRGIMEVCFENREADVGRFLRRQLAGGDVAKLTAALKTLGMAEGKAHGVGTAEAKAQSLAAAVGTAQDVGTADGKAKDKVPEALSAKSGMGPSLRDRTLSFLNTGEDRFKRAITARTLKPDEKSAATETGSWEVAMVIDPPLAQTLPDQVFLSTIVGSNPQLTGWPVWLDSRSFTDPQSRPKVTDKGWEVLIVSLEGWSRHIDFYRFEPKGEFYLWRNLQDDVSDKIKPGTLLEPIIVILRVTETIAVGLSIAKALTQDVETTRIGFAFRWKKLKGRKLDPWANPGIIPISAFESAYDDEVTTYVETSLDTPTSAIAPLVDQAIQDLFVLFGGYRFPTKSTELWVQKLLERKVF